MDVFLLDSDFKIERPKRYYRTLLHYEKQDNDHPLPDQTPQIQISPLSSEKMSMMSSIRTRVSRIFSLSNVHHEHDIGCSDSVSSVDSDFVPSRVPTPMLNPSTNINPLQRGEFDEHNQENDATPEKNAPVPSDVSKHTFYLLNSQTRLKISARNEVIPCPIFIIYFFFSEIIFLLSASNDAVHYCPREDRGFMSLYHDQSF